MLRTFILPLDSDGLVLVALRVDHNVGLIKDKDVDLLQVNHSETRAPVEQRARRTDDDVVCQLLTSHN